MAIDMVRGDETCATQLGVCSLGDDMHLTYGESGIFLSECALIV